MKHLQKNSKRLPLVIRNNFLKKYKQILNLLVSLLIIYFILSISGCIEGNVKNYAYILSVSDVCTYENVNGSMFVLVDTGSVNEGLTISGKAKGSGSYEKNFNTSLIHNFNNTGQSKFSGSIVVDLINSGINPAYCSIYAIIKFPTKGSEQQDLNYLYLKVFDVYIGLSYYKYN
jgi:hypothetical protein